MYRLVNFNSSLWRLTLSVMLYCPYVTFIVFSYDFLILVGLILLLIINLIDSFYISELNHRLIFLLVTPQVSSPIAFISIYIIGFITLLLYISELLFLVNLWLLLNQLHCKILSLSSIILSFSFLLFIQIYWFYLGY